MQVNIKHLIDEGHGIRPSARCAGYQASRGPLVSPPRPSCAAWLTQHRHANTRRVPTVITVVMIGRIPSLQAINKR